MTAAKEEGVEYKEAPYKMPVRRLDDVKAARELDLRNIPNKSWQGEHLVSTRGCGLVMAPVGRVTNRDRPDYIDVDLDRPELYFSPAIDGYAIAGTEVAESPCGDDIDYAGKRVGIIGAGATTVQMVPVMAQKAGSVTVFHRTPNFILPACTRTTPPTGPTSPTPCSNAACARRWSRRCWEKTCSGCSRPCPSAPIRGEPDQRPSRRPRRSTGCSPTRWRRPTAR